MALSVIERERVGFVILRARNRERGGRIKAAAEKNNGVFHRDCCGCRRRRCRLMGSQRLPLQNLREFIDRRAESLPLCPDILREQSTQFRRARKIARSRWLPAASKLSRNR